MRTNINRQTRRSACCIRARRRREDDHAVAAGAGRAGDLAQVAARIAQELELSPDAIDELLWGPPERPGGRPR